MLSASTQAIALLPGVDEYEIVKERYLEKGLGTSPFSFRRPAWKRTVYFL